MRERSFSTRRGAVRIVFGRGSERELGNELATLGVSRPAVIATPGRHGDASTIADAIGAKVIPLAREHVPVDTVTRGVQESAGCDALVAFGGGSAIGLAKAIALETNVTIVALPTTFSGSEMTSMFGITTDGVKRTGRDERARPRLVVYDANRVDELPADVATTSLWNAIAHAVEAIWAPDIDRATQLTAEEALRLLAGGIADRDRALEGAYLAGVVLGDVNGGIHHKLCHVLGGTFSMPHAATHAALLPHVVRWMASAAPEPMAILARAFGSVDPVGAIEQLAIATGVPRSLGTLGFAAKDIPRVVDAVLAAPPPSLRKLDRKSLTELLDRASASPRTPAAPTVLRAPKETGTQGGFGSTHSSEALDGALPRRQNTPRPSPHGLFPELISGTPFTLKNALNSRVWLYRIRPSFLHEPFRPLPRANVTSVYGDVEPTRTRWRPLPIPKGRADFIDGLVTLGGEGTTLGPGYAIHLYAANADMNERVFSSADGDILLAPQSGTLDVRTELGWLRVPPGSIAVIPRGIKFAVGVPDGLVRGWMCEVYGPRFRLPERGPVGSNALADARHFLAPTASYEDRAGTFEWVHRIGGRLYTTTQEHSPFDVVAWQGVHVPFVYDLSLFSPIGTTLVDHIDPSAHTVLTAPLDDHGRAIVDFVVFRGRWDVAEHSFRPPYSHRNAATEINCVVTTSPIEAGYESGCTFISPLLTAHGITTASYDAELDDPEPIHEGPRRLPEESLWIMFESAMPFRPTAWARETPLLDPTFLAHFQGLRSRFAP